MKTLLIPLAAVIAISCGRSTPTESPAASPVAVETAVVAMQPLPRLVESGGIVNATTSATLAGRIVATVTAVRVRAGDRVQAGDLLVQLDDRDLTAARQRAEEGAIAAGRAREAATAEREAAMADQAFARTTSDRIGGLFTREAATAQERDQAAAALRAAEARAAAAEARVTQFAAEAAAAGHAVTASGVSASFAAIRAPFAGVVVERLVDPGDLTAPGMPLLRLDGTGGFRLDVVVDDARLPGLAPGTPVEAVIDGAGTMPANVVEIARQGGNAHAFVVKIALPDRTGLRSGLFGRARFSTGTADALVVPRRALVTRGQLSMVWVIADGHARMRAVAPGEGSTADAVEVVGGVTAGERVIVAPPPGLRDGDPVTVSGGGR